MAVAQGDKAPFVKRGLFKYFSTGSYELEKFLRRQVRLVPPKYFNDPWEFLIRAEPQTELEIRAQFERFENESGYGNRTEQEKEALFRSFVASVTSAHFQEGEGPHLQENLSALFGVVSLTAEPLNRVMWAHYSDSHRGFVAEFKVSGETKWQGLPAVMTPFGPAREVPYEKTLKRFDTRSPDNTKIFWAKHKAWRYESEWRVIGTLQESSHDPKDGKTFYLLDFQPQGLLRLIFGLRVDHAVKDRLLEMLKDAEFAHVKKEIVKIDSESGDLIARPFPH